MMQCPFCGKWFKNLRLHLHYCKMKNPANICPGCGKEFKDIHELFEHLKTCEKVKEAKAGKAKKPPIRRFRGIMVVSPKPIEKKKLTTRKIEPKSKGELLYQDDKIAVILLPTGAIAIEPLEEAIYKYRSIVPVWTWSTRKETAELFTTKPKPSFEPVVIPGNIVKKGMAAVIVELAQRGLLKRWYIKRFLKALETHIIGRLKELGVW